MTTFDKSKPPPSWLMREHDNKNTRRGQRYYLHLYNAQPDWASRPAINSIYRQARELRKQGHAVHVDHLFPLIHPLFCGLHVPANLVIIGAKENLQKSNIFSPGLEQLDMFRAAFFELEYQL